MPQAPSVDLAEPALLGHSVQVTQQVNIAWQEHEHQLMVVWSQQGGVFQVVGLSAAGQVLFRADLNSGHYRQQTFVAELDQFDLQQLLRHIQIAYWPETVIAELLLKGKELLVVEPLQRMVRRADKLMATYAFETSDNFSSVRISADKQPSLTVTTLSVQKLDVVNTKKNNAIQSNEPHSSKQEHAP